MKQIKEYLISIIKPLILVLSAALMFIIFLIGCNRTESVKKDSIYHYSDMEGGDLYIHEFDSCQWIGSLERRNTDVLAHRPQCKYCKARNSKDSAAITPTLLDSMITDAMIKLATSKLQK